MAEIRVQVAYHFKLDPAGLTPGAVRIPEMITRTISVGEELITEKVASAALSLTDRAALVVEIEKAGEGGHPHRPAGRRSLSRRRTGLAGKS